MKDNIKKASKKIFWAFFIAWNIFILYIISDKRDIKGNANAAQNSQIIQKQEPTHGILQENSKCEANFRKQAEQQKTVFENDNARYEFVGNKLQSVFLKKYHTTSDRKEMLPILNNEGIFVAWHTDSKIDQIDKNIVWQIKKDQDKIIMQYTNKDKITFVQTWHFNNNIDNYGIKIEANIINNSKNKISANAFVVMNKKEFEKHQSLIFSGISISDNKKIKNIKPQNMNLENVQANSGWCAFNEKYWLVACISNQATRFLAQKTSVQSDYDMPKHDVAIKDNYELQVINQTQDVQKNENANTEFNIYIGPKDLNTLKKFGQEMNMPNIENTIDYGWLFFLTKPVNYILKLLIEKLASIVAALLLLTVLLKLLSWPFTRSSHIAMKRMQELTPEINEIRQRLKATPELMNREIFALYKRHKINPISGCLPSFLQMLFLFPLYKVLSISIDLRNAAFPFWINDLSLPDPTSFVNLFGLLPFNAPDFLHIGAWPILMGITMIVQQMLSSVPVMDKNSKMLQYMLPIFFTWIMSTVAAGVVIYWTITNVLTIVQILWINNTEKRRKRIS